MELKELTQHYGECPDCGRVWIIDEAEDDIILKPWPHVECPICGGWISLF